MNTLQSITAVIALIFALSVIVQAIQEFIKDFLNTKPRAMMRALDEFMGSYLNSADVQNALRVRGLDLTALEKFSTSDFRNLLDAIPFQQQQLQGIVQNVTASLDQIKGNIAGAYQGALARFNQIYTKKNKQIAVLLSAIVVLALNANAIFLYEGISVDPVTQQAIMSKIQTITSSSTAPSSNDQVKDLKDSYVKTRGTVAAALHTDQSLVRTMLYPDDFPAHWLRGILGLLLMIGLVSLGAPFWNDVLKGATGVNNAFNGNTRQS